jgi:hypothetical protein
MHAPERVQLVVADAHRRGVDHGHGAGATIPARLRQRTVPLSTPGFPLPLRNALATLAIAALDADDARAALAWLAAPDAPPAPVAADRLVALHLIDPGTAALLAVHAAHTAAVRAHAARAVDAGAAFRARPSAAAGSVDGALQRAATLWDRRLFFEVHEVLEDVWQRTAGSERQALQGVIQIAVAFHHLAHGNVRGARKLLEEGRERLAATPAVLPALDAPALLASTAYWETALASGSAPTDTPPRLPLVE